MLALCLGLVNDVGQPGAAVVRPGDGRSPRPAQRHHPQLGPGQRRSRCRPGHRRRADRHAGRRGLLPDQRGRAIWRSSCRWRRSTSPRLRPAFPWSGRAASCARGWRTCAAPRPSPSPDDDGHDRHAGLRVPGRPAGRGAHHLSRRPRRLRLPDRRHGRGSRRRGPGGCRPRAHGPQATGGRRGGIRRRHPRRCRRADPGGRGRRARLCRRRKRGLPGHRQHHPAARRRAGDARPGDVAVGGRLPWLDAHRRPDRRLRGREGRSALGAGARWRGGPRGRRRRGGDRRSRGRREPANPLARQVAGPPSFHRLRRAAPAVPRGWDAAARGGVGRAPPSGSPPGSGTHRPNRRATAARP